MTVLNSGSASDVGRVRTLNEDLAYEGGALFAVADGMGGHAGGEVASRTAIDALRAGFEQQPNEQGLVEAIHVANQAVWERGRSDPALRGMGTTLIVAALVRTEEGERIVVANVGDSRGYLLHDGQLGQLTVDHSVAEELVARGELSEREAQIHPQRHILTRALGVDADVDVDVWEVIPQRGDRFLLCSDGLSNEVSSEEIRQVLNERLGPGPSAETLVRLANQRGGNDNITAVVVDVVAEGSDSRGSDSYELYSGAAGAPAGTALGVLARPDAADARDGAPGQTRATALVAPTDLEQKEQVRAPGEERGPSTEARRSRQRRITFRVLLFFVILGAIAYGAFRLVNWYVDNSYYVALDKGHVTIFQGRQGGFLGIDPKVVRISPVTSSDLNSVLSAQVSQGVEEPSRSDAQKYVSNLEDVLCAQVPPPQGLTCPPSGTNLPASGATPSQGARLLPTQGRGAVVRSAMRRTPLCSEPSVTAFVSEAA